MLRIQDDSEEETLRNTISGRADFERYFAAFNARDYALQTSFYAPDVEYAVGTFRASSPAEIGSFYADFHQYCDEVVRLAWFAMTGDIVSGVVPTRFEPFRDYFKHGLEFRAGEPRDSVTLAFWQLENGRIRRIRMARYGGPASDFD